MKEKKCAGKKVDQMFLGKEPQVIRDIYGAHKTP